MKKIGIVTFFKANNFGVCLQAFATYEFIRRNGYDVEIINYINPYEHRIFKWAYKEGGRAIGYISSLAKNILLGKKHYYKRGFSHVTDHYDLSCGEHKAKDTMNALEYDVLVAGSDQIWNPQITGGLDEVFLLQFGQAQKRISLASSLGSQELKDTDKENFTRALKNFSAISVREEFAKQCLQPLTEKEIKVLMDPTFLFCRNEWLNMLGKASKYYNSNEKYILTYFIASNKADYQQRVKAYADKLGLPVWSIQFSNYHWKVSSKRILGASIEDFIALVSNAALILTDSFHGTAFSLNLQKDFVPFRHSANPLRIIDLLQKLGIGERLDMAASEYQNVNYSLVNPKLEGLREDSKNWVLHALNDET